MTRPCCNAIVACFIILAGIFLSPVLYAAPLRYDPPTTRIVAEARQPDPPTDYTRLDQDILDIVNEMRRDPGAFYHKYLPDYIRNHPGRFTDEYTRSLKQTMLSSGPLPRFESSSALDACASRQYRYLARFKGRQLTHDQGDASFADRMKQVGLHCLAENLYDADHPRALEVVVDLLIDQHIPSLGHRKNLMNPMYTHLGIVSGTPPGGRTIVVMDFGCGK